MADTDKDVGPMADLFNVLNDKVKRNVRVLTPEDIGQGYLLHISTNPKLKTMTPIIGRRQAKTEDRSVPRITTTPTLLGCMIGYAKLDEDFMQGHREKSYLGGFIIYALNYEAALVPNEKLVFDAERSGETWLVQYSPETAKYEPIEIGKGFCRSIRYVAKNKEYPDGEAEFFVEINKADGIRFSKNHHLSPGYWRLSGPSDLYNTDWREDSNWKVESINKMTYLENKRASADMLSFTETVPTYLGW